VGAALPATTSLSAALLAAAGEGYAVPDVVRLVTRCVAGSTNRTDGPGGPDDPGIRPTSLSVDPSGGMAELVARVLAIGHTSGRDLLSGVTGALRAVDAHDVLDPAKEGAPRG
jgi:hypothetical protein